MLDALYTLSRVDSHR